MATVTPHSETHLDPRRWWALGALVASMLVLGFDMTILNVALPTMAGELGASTGEQQWMADAYVVVFAALMLPAGLLGDRFGRRRMLMVGLGVFLAGSLVGALARRCDLGRRRPCRDGRGRRAGDAARPVRPALALPAHRAHQGGRRHLGRVRARHAARPDHRRLAARPLLVGLGLPDQRPDGRDRHRRLPLPAAGDPRPGLPQGRRRLHRAHRGRARRADLRDHRGADRGWGDPARCSP